MTVVFADVAGSDALLERIGEYRYLALLASYEALLDGCAAEHGGARERRRAEGQVLAFRSARAAVRCAVALQLAVAGGLLPFRVRVGVHSGELERRDGELRGRALVKAARIGGLAGGGRSSSPRWCASWPTSTTLKARSGSTTAPRWSCAGCAGGTSCRR